MGFAVLLSAITLTQVIALPIDTNGHYTTKNGDQQGRNEDHHSGVQLNGTNQVPPLQSLYNSKMFPTPTLSPGNEIIIKGRFDNDSRVNITIATSYSTVCEIEVANGANNGDDFLKIISHGNVVNSSLASDTFVGDIPDQYIFRLLVGNGTIRVFSLIDEDGSDNHLYDVEVDVNDIKTISATGKVEKISFIFK